MKDARRKEETIDDNDDEICEMPRNLPDSNGQAVLGPGSTLENVRQEEMDGQQIHSLKKSLREK